MSAEKVEKKLMGIAACAAATDLSTWWWRRAAYSGLVESVKCGSRLLIPISEVNRIIAENTRPRVA